MHEIASAMKNTGFVMVPDTGLYHMSVATGTPIFCIFTYTNPAFVLPDEGIIESCFVEDKFDENIGLHFGTAKIESYFLKMKIDILLKKTKNESLDDFDILSI